MLARTSGMRLNETLEESEAEWLEARGIDLEMADRMGLRTAAGIGPGRWIGLPYFKLSEIVACKFRRTDEKDHKQFPGGEQIPWNYDCLIDETLAAEPLVICEGEWDALVAMQAGYVRCISAPNGAPKHAGDTASSRYEWIGQVEPLLKDKAKQIILATDGDGPGLALQADLSTRLGAGRCKYVVYPLGAKDLNDTLRLHGAQAVLKALKDARWCKVKGLCKFGDLMPLPKPVSHVINLGDLSKHYRPRLGDLCVITGIPGAGKSAFANELACRFAEEHGWRTCFGNFETTAQTDHREQLLTWYKRKPERMQSAAEIEDGDAWLNEYFSLINADEDEALSLDYCLDAAATAAVRYNARCLILDPWNEIEHQLARGQMVTDYIGDALRILRRFARRWNMHVIVVAHPTKMERNKDGSLVMPSLYDISGSAHWRNKADVGMIVYRSGENETLVRVEKSKHFESMGFPGDTTLYWNSYQGRFGSREEWGT